MLDVNAHLHTPYSFSAFSSIGEALDKAAEEGVKVVGINDFYSTDGYGEWKEGCAARGLFPLFGIEFIALNAEDQAAGLRVNDPNNPGRTYISGKGLACPPILAGEPLRQLQAVRAESNAQVERMCAKLNEWLKAEGYGIVLDFNRNYITQAVISDSVLEYCNRMVVANGNSSKKSMIYLTHNHFEGARGSGKIAVELNNFSAQVSGNLFDENLKDVLSISSAAGNEIEVRDVKWNQVKFNGGNRGTILFESSDGRRLDTRR